MIINKIISSNPAGFNVQFRAGKMPKASFEGFYDPTQVSIPASMRENLSAKKSVTEQIANSIKERLNKLKDIEMPTSDYIDSKRGVLVHYTYDGSMYELPLEKVNSKLAELHDGQIFEGFLPKDELLNGHDFDLSNIDGADIVPENGADIFHEFLDKLAETSDFM